MQQSSWRVRRSPLPGDKNRLVDDLEQALYAAKIVSYAQGYMLLDEGLAHQQLGSRLPGDCFTVAGWVHYKIRLSGRHSRGLYE